MKLFRYELKKLLSMRYLPFTVILLLFINTFNIYENHDAFITPALTLSGGEYVSHELMRYELEKSFFGEITQAGADRLNALIEKAKAAQAATGNAPWSEGFFRQPGGDRLAGERLMEEMRRLYSYDERVIAPLLEKNGEFAASAPSAYSARLAARMERVYGGRIITEYYRVNEYRPLLEYKLSSLFLMLIAVYAASGLFAGERETRMFALQKSTALGAKRLYFVKLAALAAFVLALSLIFYAEDFALFDLCRRPSGLAMPLYSINDLWGNYEYSPLNISVLGFIILLWPVRALGAFTAAMVGALLSVLLRRPIAAFLAALVCTAGLMALTMFTDGVFSWIRWFDPVTLLIYPRLAENFIVRDVLGLPLFAHELAPAGCALMLACLSAASFMLYRRRNADA